MKIHQTIGLVAGVHALAFLLIFVSPGCSSTNKSASADAGAASAPVVATAPLAAPSPVQDAPAPMVPMSSGNAFYSPTRPNTAAAEALSPAAPAPDVTPAETYTVRSGDSLWLIAHHHHLKVSELAAANNLRSTASLHAGQKLLIPQAAARGEGAPATEGARGDGATAAASTPAGGANTANAGPAAAGTTYTVKSGDKLSSIARRYGLTTGALAAENNISDPRKIRPGQVLQIPAGGAAHHSRHSHAAAAAPAPAPESSSAPVQLEPITAPPGTPPPADSSTAVPIIRIDGSNTSGAAAPSSAH
ncbi:MAG TPA: LysM peptidoglycan-binding domain-containing protein [Opitutaceae bacterium]|jgi:LysM repeat protein